MAPTRSQSVGSLMDFTNPAEKRIKDLISEDKPGPKRKLETTVSTNVIGEGLKRRDKIIKENTVADITIHGTIHENASMEDASMTEAPPLDKSLTRTISRDMDVEPIDEATDPALQGAACKEIIEDSNKKEAKKTVKVKKTPTGKNTTLEGVTEKANVENAPKNVDKENVKAESKIEKSEEKPEVEKTTTKKKTVKKKVLADKNENTASKTKVPEVAKVAEAAKAVEVAKADETKEKAEEEKAEDGVQVCYIFFERIL